MKYKTNVKVENEIDQEFTKWCDEKGKVYDDSNLIQLWEEFLREKGWLEIEDEFALESNDVVNTIETKIIKTTGTIRFIHKKEPKLFELYVEMIDIARYAYNNYVWGFVGSETDTEISHAIYEMPEKLWKRILKEYADFEYNVINEEIWEDEEFREWLEGVGKQPNSKHN